MTSLTISLMWCALQVTLFTAVAAVFYLFARRLEAAIGSAIAVTSLIAVLVLTLLAASPWPRWEWDGLREGGPPIAETATLIASGSTAAPIAPEGPPTPIENNAPETPSPLVAAWDAFTNAIVAAEPIAETDNLAAAWNRPLVVCLIAASCLLVSMARLGWGIVEVRRLVRGSTPIDDAVLQSLLAQLCEALQHSGKVALRESAEVATPAMVGWWRPAILLPASWHAWSAGEAQSVLAHELAHVVGRDYLSWIVARLAVAVHFYHPLVHWLAGRLQLEQELAADAVAVRLVGDRQQYLHTLASLALATPAHRMSGPARTLIPSRSLLMRRVEMLRAGKHLTDHSKFARAMRYTALGVLAAVAIAVAGVRQAATGQESPKVYDVVDLSTVKTPDRIPLSVAPDDTIYVASARPAELLTDAAFQPLVSALSELPPLQKSGLAATDVAEVMVIVYGGPKAQRRFVCRFITSEACDKFMSYVRDQPNMKQVPGAELNTLRDDSEQVVRFDKSTLIVDHFATNEATGESVPPLDNAAPLWANEWKKSDDHQLAIAFDTSAFRKLFSAQVQQRLIGGFPMQAVAPLLLKTDWGVASIDLSDGFAADAIAECHSPEDAQTIANIVQSLIELSGNVVELQKQVAKTHLNQLPSEEAAKMRPNLDTFSDLASELTEQAKPVTEGNRVLLEFKSERSGAEIAAMTVQLMLPAVQAARAAGRRTQSENNLRQLALGVLNYESANGRFPPAAGTAENQHPHSWRIDILPYLEHQSLYDQYKFEEPWDSEANKKVLAQMPAVFRSPFDAEDSTNTSYFALTGPGTIFDGDEGTRLREITDGMSNTILLVEAKRAVPWTKPEDIAYAAAKPLPELGGWQEVIFQAALCDGRVEHISLEIEEDRLRAFITKAGGETVQRPQE